LKAPATNDTLHGLSMKQSLIIIAPEKAEEVDWISWNLMTDKKAAQEQFARQSHRYGQGHILEDIADVQAAWKPCHCHPMQ
jgi:hypothetical protein